MDTAGIQSMQVRASHAPLHESLSGGLWSMAKKVGAVCLGLLLLASPGASAQTGVTYWQNANGTECPPWMFVDSKPTQIVLSMTEKTHLRDDILFLAEQDREDVRFNGDPNEVLLVKLMKDIAKKGAEREVEQMLQGLFGDQDFGCNTVSVVPCE